MSNRKAGRKPERKPLSFSTTMRNPNRIADFLNCLLPYEGQTLTHDVIMQLIRSLIEAKLYTPNYVRQEPELNRIFKSEEETYSKEQIEDIIAKSPQNHKEADFAHGWDSRFDTLFKLPMEFGFIKYAMDEPIRISRTGHMLIDLLRQEKPNEKMIQMVFLNSMMKYQSNNPYRKNANANIPFILLLQVLKMLKEDKEENGAGVFRQELSLFICWPDNDAAALYHKIKQIRKKVGFSYSDEYMYDICLKLLGATDKQRKRFKLSQICGEAVDEYIRKMRTTGVISLRGNGRFIDYNVWEIEKINYILQNYSRCRKFVSKNKYFAYMGDIDTIVINMSSAIPEDTTDLRKSTLKRLADDYSKETICKELYKVGNKQASSDDMLKLLPGPVRLEFLTSIAMVQNFENLDVIPNYSIDDEGLPTNTASGGQADIVCRDGEYQGLLEVTLMRGRQEQIINEIIPIRRHLRDEKQSHEKTFAVFIAPVVHEDTKEIAEWYKHKDNLDIVTYTINEFAGKIQSVDKIGKLVKE